VVPSPQHTEALKLLLEADPLLHRQDHPVGKGFAPTNEYVQLAVRLGPKLADALAALVARDKALEEALRDADLTCRALSNTLRPQSKRLANHLWKKADKFATLSSVGGGAAEPAAAPKDLTRPELHRIVARGASGWICGDPECAACIELGWKIGGTSPVGSVPAVKSNRDEGEA
jgi:hypothetical protein